MLFCATCKKSHNVPKRGYLTADAVHCPICKFQALKVTNEEDASKEHHVCPHCMSNPPKHLAWNAEQKLNNFRCFSCAHPECTLSKGVPGAQAGVAKCPLCGTSCSIRKARTSGSLYVKCDLGTECDFVYWLPTGLITNLAAVDAPAGGAEARCQKCHSRILNVKWRHSAVPAGTREFTGCIWCDRKYADVLRATGNDRALPRPPHPGSIAGGAGGANARDIEDAPGNTYRGRGRARGRGLRRNTRAKRRLV